MRNVKSKGTKSPAELVGLKPFKGAKLLRREAIERMKRHMERKLKQSREEARLARPYVQDADAPSFDGAWLG